ncbi:LysR family transcriptional regulator [Tateyamaria sp.]|uniref:LysR family transcriptional regulator n=1 Tax=Tateyamaria sp. TaxID=1929288 RepID=UPI00329E0F8D
MKLQQLRYFAAVFEQGSFSAAAEKVNATQSGLSMHVSQIEKRYDVVLFERSSSGVTPTAAGKAFYLEAVKVLAAASHAEDRIRALSKTVVGHVRVGLMPTFTRAILTSALLRFASEYPEVQLSISEAYSGALADDVAEGLLDFAVVPAAFDLRDQFVTHAMGKDHECLVCSLEQEFPTRDGQVVLKDLPPLQLVLPGKSNARRHNIEAYLAVNGIQVKELMELDTMHGTLDLVSRSNWVSILPRVLCLPDLDGNRRRVLPLIDPPLSVDYMRIETSSRPLNQAARAFADILEQELNTRLDAPLSGSNTD